MQIYFRLLYNNCNYILLPFCVLYFIETYFKSIDFYRTAYLINLSVFNIDRYFAIADIVNSCT